MKTQTTKKSWWNRSEQVLLPVLVALLFFAFTFAYFPFREKLQFDTDEGLNLMRSMLVRLGYPLYSEVSSDQPPLFTHVLALLFGVVGFEVNPARMLVLLFSTFLVWSAAQFLQITSGRMAAILFLPLAIMLPRYLMLSTAVMIGVPSIAFAAASMTFAVVWHLQRKNVWLVLSGFMLAFSVLIKLFTGFVAPIFFIGITLAEYFIRKDDGLSWKLLRPALVWSVSFGALAALLGVALIGLQNVWLMISPAINAPAQTEFQGDYFSMNTHLQAAIPLLVLGLLGALIVVLKRKWLLLYPLAWAALAYALFSFYSPVFYHHQLLITIPMAMVAAAGAGEAISPLIQIRKTAKALRPPTIIIGVLALVSFVWVVTTYAPQLDRELMDSPRISGFDLRATSGKLKILREMGEYAEQTNWILTDMPMYAFRVGKPVPPIVATFSSKRLATGSLTEADILATIREYQPEQVMMARFEIPALEQYLSEHYTLISSKEFFRLFLRNDLMSTTE